MTDTLLELLSAVVVTFRLAIMFLRWVSLILSIVLFIFIGIIIAYRNPQPVDKDEILNFIMIVSTSIHVTKPSLGILAPKVM